MKKFLSFLLIASLFMSACSSVLSRSDGKGGYDYAEEAYYGYGGAADMELESVARNTLVASTDDMAVDQDEQKIIKTGSLGLHVSDVQEEVAAIEQQVAEWGGRVLYSNVNRGSNSYSASVQVRVAADQFEVAMEALKEMSIYVESEYVSADDITEAYADTEARLNNAREEESQYLAILDTAGTMSEVLEVTQAISSVRYRIEAYETQLQNYDTRVDYSTISISLTEDDSVTGVSKKWRPLQVISDAFGDWIVFLQGAVDAVVYIAIFGWPILIVLWVVKRKRRSKK